MSVTKSKQTIDKIDDRHEIRQPFMVAIPIDEMREAFYFTDINSKQQIVNHIVFELLQRISDLEKEVTELKGER